MWQTAADRPAEGEDLHGEGASTALPVQIGGELLSLLPQKAVWWPAQRTLLVADAHFGKATSFRRHGVAVPRGTTSETLAALSALVAAHGAERIVFLGDFLHSAHAHAASTIGALARWRTLHAGLALTLVRGNHDRHAGDPPPHLGIEVVDEPLALGGIALCHHPVAQPGRYVLAGHLHPCIRIGGRAHDSLRLACFHFGEHVGVLPAFGAFTGTHRIRRVAGDRVFVIAEDRVVALPPADDAAPR
jgi:DNA ligase-associated metallophosphoesterase